MTMEGVGLVCPRENGLYEVFGADLQSQGFIHGNDPIPEPDASGVGALAGTSPACVAGTAGTYYIQVIYARATNDADQYAALLNQVRYLVGQATKLIDDAAVATGGTGALKVKCISGQVEVKNEALPTTMTSASFSTIVTDLKNKGYNDPKVKYWVFYDDTGACTCGGQGHLYGDDALAVTNLNNGNAANPTFAVNYGYNSTRVWLHELGHNLGAVQDSAPHTTLAGHCIDGRDTMCYNDGGPNGGSYSTGFCATEIFDCGKDDYFHRSPVAGSYLATKWNLGNAFNRYIDFGTPGAPTLTSLVCPSSAETGQSISCTFVATDDSSGVRYTVNWGDSTSSVIPSPSTYATPGVTQSASKTYASGGTRTITVSVVDSTGISGNSLASSINVIVDNPIMTLLSCPTPVESGTLITCSIRATDASSGVKYTVNWGDSTTSTIPTSGFVTPGVTQSATKTYATPGTRTVSVFATDIYAHAGSSLSQSVNVVYDLTPPTLTVTDPHGSTIYYGCAVQVPTSPVATQRGIWVDNACVRATASDARSGVNRVEVLVNNVLMAIDTTAPYDIQFPVPSTQTNAALVVRAIDNAGNVRTVSLGVDMVS